MTPHDYFSAVAVGYARYRPHYPSALFDHLAELAPHHGLAWDCAAGSGQATTELATRFDRVIATDMSASQLSQAPAHPRIEYRVAAAETSGLEPASIDLVTVAQALHWLPLEGFYAEVRRVLAPRGIIAVWSYSGQGIDGGPIDAVIARFYRETVGPHWAPERVHVDGCYRTLPFPFDELAAPAFSMKVEWTLEEVLGYLRTWSATAAYIEAHGVDPVEGVASELAPLWGDPRAQRHVQWPLALRIGRG